MSREKRQHPPKKVSAVIFIHLRNRELESFCDIIKGFALRAIAYSFVLCVKLIIVFVIAVKFFPFSVVENIEHLINILAVYVDKPDRAILADTFDAAIQRSLVLITRSQGKDSENQ